MRFEPERAGRSGRIHTGFLPPGRLIAAAMDLAMMTAAEGHREFVAHLSTQRPTLREAQMMRIGRCATTNQTWLFGNEPYVLAIANAARFGVAKFALIDLPSIDPSSQLTSFDFTASADLMGTTEFRELQLKCGFDLFGISCDQRALGRERPMCPGCGFIARADALEFSCKPIAQSA
jgi:hypothetical protein